MNTKKERDKEMKSERIRKYMLTPRNLMKILMTGGRFETLSGIPDNAEFRGFCHSVQNNSLAIYVEHPSFEEVYESREYLEGPSVRFETLETEDDDG